MTSITDYEIESDVDVDGASITAIVDGEEQDDVDIIGHLISYTIGSDFVVPRAWLKERMEELDLYITTPGGQDELMLPPKVTPKRAFNRTRDRIVQELTLNLSRSEFDGEGKAKVGGRMMHFDAKKATNDEWHVTAEAFFDADELGPEADDGEWRQTTLGIFRYNQENQAMMTVPKVDEDDAMWETWTIFAEGAMKMFKQMQESHVGRDIQKMVNRFTKHWTNTLKVRDGGAVYFVPAGYDNEVRALKTLIDEINEQHKDRGRDCELLRISVTNSEEERKQIEERAEKHVQEQVESALEAAFDSLSDDDSVVDEIADDLEDRLEELDAFADDYNALLSARLSAQEVLSDKLGDLEGAKEEVVEKALEEAEEAPTP